MPRIMLRSKIHLAAVTQCDLDYERFSTYAPFRQEEIVAYQPKIVFVNEKIALPV